MSIPYWYILPFHHDVLYDTWYVHNISHHMDLSYHADTLQYWHISYFITLDAYKYDMYNIYKYDNIHICSSGRKGCSVSDYVHEKVPFTVKLFDSGMNDVFIKIIRDIFNTKSNIVVVVVCKIIDTPINVFSDPGSYTLNTVDRERKICCYFLADLNIDFLKHSNTSLPHSVWTLTVSIIRQIL